MSTGTPAPGSTSAVVRHNFETGHRLPHLEGKCQSLHGHSWWAEVTATAPEHPTLVIEFGQFKASLRSWIDTHLDHGVMLGLTDPLATLLTPSYAKVHIFNEADGSWPTVENVAALIARISTGLISEIVRAPGTSISEVRIRETHVNEAVWRST